MTIYGFCGIFYSRGDFVDKTIPLRKQSKKAQKAYHARQRGSWYGLSPVTRIAPNGKAYNRRQEKRVAWTEE